MGAARGPAGAGVAVTDDSPERLALLLQFAKTDDAELHCVICGRDGPCGYEATIRLDGRRVWVGAHQGCLDRAGAT